MLTTLRIKNLAIVADLTLELQAGCTVITGETGAGKSIVIGALNLVLGERAGADVVRRGAAKAAVTLEFEPDKNLRERLCADGFEFESRHYRSLSAIAREVTGTRWNGLLFFGLAERRNA